MALNSSYFSITSPMAILDNWLHPYRHTKVIDFQGKHLRIAWTSRAEKKLRQRKTPLIVEMQIYFSCVIQKRVLFHEQSVQHTEHVNDRLAVLCRPVQAESCDPVKFAEQHPVDHEYQSAAAQRLRPAELRLDYKHGEWYGEFSI